MNYFVAQKEKTAETLSSQEVHETEEPEVEVLTEDELILQRSELLGIKPSVLMDKEVYKSKINSIKNVLRGVEFVLYCTGTVLLTNQGLKIYETIKEPVKTTYIPSVPLKLPSIKWSSPNETDISTISGI